MGATVPVKCKFTVSTRNSILDAFQNRESGFEAQVSSFETLEEFFEKTIKNDLYLEFVTIEVNNTARGAASFTRTCISYIESTSKSLVWS